MICLNDQQFAQLEDKLKSEGIQRDGRYHDLLDHFYCLTSFYMEAGQSFETASKQAYQEIAPDGFSAIEQELNLFLTFNIQIRMNKVLYSTAFAAAFGQTMYLLFKTLHWPGGPAFLMMACASILCVVVPILVFKYIKGRAEFSLIKLIRFMAGIIAISLFSIGSALKIMHLPTANTQIVLGSGILALVFFPLYFYEQYQSEVESASKVPLAKA